MKHDNADFAGRRDTARQAKAALLEKAKAKLADPALEARRAERALVVAARAEREAARAKEAEAQALEEAERQRVAAEVAAQEEAVRQEALEAELAAEKAKAKEADKHVASFLRDEAALKAARDARYAARQARRNN
ncbi:hypothetical protein GGR04_002383 [Aureimonas pseudogalii]|uniref:Uncharacterized protein n=1 Tax=Aureimonas pseudogalii TaxID=1744844 RepID=A0A7W6EC36_9HYPH|nr:hypothetical protein [Aureimonas pseudogalii]